MLRKNDITELTVTGMTNEGCGVGRADGIAVFVPDTAVGDVISCRIVKVAKSYCYGIVDKLITPSVHRCDPGCAVYKKCGGCSFRHFTYEEELRIKQEFVEASFSRIGRLSPVFEPILGAEVTERYRNKAQYPVAEMDDRAVCGFYSKRSHRVIPADDCLLGPEIFSRIAAECIDYVNQNRISPYDELTGRGLLRHIYLRRGEHSGEIMLCFVVTGISEGRIFAPLAQKLCERYSELVSVVLNENPKRTNAILGSRLETLCGRDGITDIMCGRKVEISPLSFYQVNTLQAERLYAIAAEYAGLTGSELLLDLYCGTGTVGLSMSDKVRKLIGVEIIPQAIENAKRNAAANGTDNAEFICGDAGKIAGMLCERGERPDVIIADPARKGCTRDTLEYMARMQPERIVMISCNHATAARDCAVLAELGYKTEKCRAVDLFPRSTHVECVVLLTRGQGTVKGG
ncbi:MAG: 23S rRNA (uracil(1939)-C(5))-methyltransferase RlmD [Ruminococcus sp.]|nr:23S rRNA (uracil(1939)-C(5))-methyltransferase RlmD [Ruminococcus sp.]